MHTSWLTGKTAVVSGGSRGIGLSIARAFADRGTRIILLGRDQETLTKALERLPMVQNERQHESMAMDVSKSSDWDALLTHHKDFDLLVNAAGVTHYSLLSRTPTSTIDHVLHTNLHGLIHGSRIACKHFLKEKKCGSIINVSSALAHRGGAGSTVYAASKAGVIGFTKALAQEMGSREIRINAIAPGYIDTHMLSGSLFYKWTRM